MREQKLSNPPMIYTPVKESVIGIKIITTKWSKITALACALMFLIGGIFFYLSIDRLFLFHDPGETRQDLEESWNRFQALTEKEIFDAWWLMFDGKRYKYEGNPEKNEYDCVSSTRTFFRNFLHSLFPFAVVFKKDLKVMLSYVDIKQFENIHKGDIIVLTYIGENPQTGKEMRLYHIGVVFAKSKYRKVIRYCDFDYDGAGFEDIEFKTIKYSNNYRWIKLVGCIGINRLNFKGVI